MGREVARSSLCRKKGAGLACMAWVSTLIAHPGEVYNQSTSRFERQCDEETCSVLKTGKAACTIDLFIDVSISLRSYLGLSASVF